MFAYVIVVIELAILYFVYWLVFVREPKPYKIKGNPWGNYGTENKPTRVPFQIELDEALLDELKELRKQRLK